MIAMRTGAKTKRLKAVEELQRKAEARVRVVTLVPLHCLQNLQQWLVQSRWLDMKL